MKATYWVGGIVIAASATWFAFVAFGDKGPDPDVLAKLLGQKFQCQRLLADMRRLGIVRNIVPVSEKEVFAYVDQQLWEGSGNSQNIANSFTVYCALTPADGYFTVTFRNPSGENIMRLKNGHVVAWF